MSISAISAGTAAAATQARATTPTKAADAPKAASTAVNTADTVSISAETKSELAQGKPFFAAAGAEGEATEGSARLGRQEKAKKARITKLQDRSDGVQSKTKLRLEKQTKRLRAKQQKIGGRLETESARKTTRGDAQGKKLAGNEERVKGSAADRTGLIAEKAKKAGVPADQERIDRIGGRVKEEAATKDAKLGAADGRRISKERQVKRRAADRFKKVDAGGEARTKQISASGAKKLNGLEERMKKLDPVKTDGADEQKIKASATATPASTTPATAETAAAATAKTDVL